MGDIYQMIPQYVSRKLYLLSAYSSEGRRKAVLAGLRHGAGRHPGSQPVIWGFLLEDMPEEMESYKGEPSYAEWAVYSALTLYGVHQQSLSLSEQNMDLEGEGQSLGKAMASLVHGEEDEDRIIRRLNVLITSIDFGEVSHHLRGIIQLLRRDKIPLDYPMLAKDLYEFQCMGGSMKVALRWGKDFYKYRYRQNQNMNGGGENEANVH